MYILLVEDDTNCLVSVARFLRQLGHDVVEINNGREALAAYTYTNDPAVIGQIDKFVSINNCIDVDLFGQINSESFGAGQISGTGGSVCFARYMPKI